MEGLFLLLSPFYFPFGAELEDEYVNANVKGGSVGTLVATHDGLGHVTIGLG